MLRLRQIDLRFHIIVIECPLCTLVLLDRGSRGVRKQVAQPRGEWDENNALAASTTKPTAMQAK